MEAFLKHVARHLIERYGENLRNTTVVLPNRRARLFLKKHLAGFIQKPFFPPQIVSTEDFISNLSGIAVTDNLQLLFDLYEVHKKCFPEKVQTLDQFGAWAERLLSDFNEIDRYMIDTRQLFSYISEARAIDTWNPDGKPLSEFQKKYLDFWASLQTYYNSFQEHLEKKGIGYQGKAFRFAAENMDKILPGLEGKKFVFAGLNALTRAEEKVIDRLLSEQLAECLWDTDPYYTDQPFMEAGMFIRRHRKNWERFGFNWMFNDFREEKEIEIIGVAGQIAQAKTAGVILERIKQSNPDLSSTALVLASENLLIPALHSLPEDTGPLNITMGYPLKKTPLYELLSGILEMIEFAARQKDGRLYHLHLQRFLRHPYVLHLFKNKEADKLLNIITRKNYSLLGTGFVKEILGTEAWTENIFHARPGLPDPLLEGMLLLCHRLLEEFSSDKKKYTLELEYGLRFIQIITHLRSYIAHFSGIDGLKTLKKVWQNLVGREQLDFIGEPLSGLQIMGVLETRTLDFENVILLSVNEDILPAGKSESSFIPNEIKRIFHLPTYIEKDAIFAYHFYRMLQRAKTVKLIYNLDHDELGGGERSRFIEQLKQELPPWNPRVKITEKIVQYPLPPAFKPAEINVPKTPEVMQGLMDYLAQKALSPSSLNMYRRCKLQFYFRYVAGLKETEEVDETIDAGLLGQGIHKVLESFYGEHLDKELSPDDIDKMIKRIPAETENGFHDLVHADLLKDGKNLLMIKAAAKIIDTFLRKEKEALPHQKLVIRGLEKTMTGSLTAGNITVNISGIADRIDEQNGHLIRIIDYKTGQVDKKTLTGNSVLEILNKPKSDKAFQLFLYGWLYGRETGRFDGLQPLIYPLKKIKEGAQHLTVNKELILNRAMISEFEEYLQGLVNDLVDTTSTFVQTENPENCKFCAFRDICLV